ncbi:MAG: TolC family protein [Saprospiraceae bacterium]|nr:TolC family protein [Lewinella sp.]
MVKKITLLILPLLALATITFSQSTSWTLQQCVDYALDNSLTIKRARNAVELASVNDLGNRMQRLPSVNASSSFGYQFGKTINPVTNTFIDTKFGGGSSSINGGILIYNGGIINNSIKQGKADLMAAQLDARASANDIALQVASAYLNILLAEEQVANAEKQLEQSTKQLEQTDRLIQAGSLPVNDRLDFVAQVALNEQTIIEAQNLVNINYLTLKQLLELDPNQELRITRPEVIIPDDANPEIFTLNEVYTSALGTQPQIEADEYRLQSAALQEKIARAQGLPRVSLGGSLSTNYSDQVAAGVDFFDQFKNNFGQSIGLSLSVPIYNNHNVAVNIERAKVNMANQELANLQNKQLLKADVQRAIADARAAKESYEASQRSVEAAQAAFDNAQKRFDLGAINTLEYSTASNNLDRAQLSLIQAKYQYLFNLKVVDFYLGREIKLD